MKLLAASVVFSAHGALLKHAEHRSATFLGHRVADSEIPKGCEPADCAPDAVKVCESLWEEKQKECEKNKKEWGGLCPAPKYTDSTGNLRDCKRGCCSEKVQDEAENAHKEDLAKWLHEKCPSETEDCTNDEECSQILQKGAKDGLDSVMDEIQANDLARAVLDCAHREPHEEHDEDGACLCGPDAEFLGHKQIPDWDAGRTCEKEIKWACTHEPSEEQIAGIQYMKHHCCVEHERPPEPADYVREACPAETEACLDDDACGALFREAFEEGHESKKEEIAANKLASAVMECLMKHEHDKAEEEKREEEKDGSCLCGEKATFFGDKELPDWNGRTCSKEIDWACTENPTAEQIGGIRYMKHHCCEHEVHPPDVAEYFQKACPAETKACLRDEKCGDIFKNIVEEGHEKHLDAIKSNELASAVMECVMHHEGEEE